MEVFDEGRTGSEVHGGVSALGGATGGGWAHGAGGGALVIVWTRFDRESGCACIAVAIAAMLHAGTRLPSGNGWDALLDPWLVVWAVVVLLRPPFRRAILTPISFDVEASNERT